MSRKRGNGEGSITKRNDGRWMARFTVHTAKGPKRRHIYGRTRQEVATKLAKAMTDRDGGIELDPSSVTVNEYLQRWLNDSVKGSVRPITFESYERLVRVHVVPGLGRVKLKALSPAHLQGLYRDRLDAGLSPSTVQRLHAVIHRALKQALRWGLVPRNVSEAVDPPKAQRKEIRPLTPEQVRTLLRTAQGDRLGALYALAITTGLRQGELFGLRWEDVDLETGRLSVRQTLTTPKGGRRLSPPKRSKSRRSVKLTTGAVKALRDHRERQLDEREKLAELLSRTHSGRTMRARARPTSIPPPPISKKLRPASHTENAPLTTAATATLKATRPVPSLTRLSPLTTVPTRSGTPNLPKIASDATGSVGARMAPSTKAAAHGRPIRACAITATAPIVASTSPTASSTIGLSWARRSSGEEEKAAEFSRGGRKAMKITSGGISMLGRPGTKPITRPPRTSKIG